MDSYSSRGPVDGNRIKPDVIAPGTGTYSADSKSRCGIIQKSGTYKSNISSSMSSPLAAGAIALIRQYLVDGYYPNSINNSY